MKQNKLASKLDLLKLGMLLLGISAIILSGIALDAYLRTLDRQEMSGDFFYAYCQDRVIIIHAEKTLENVSVTSSKNEEICSFKEIPEYSEEVCDVSNFNSTVFTIKTKTLKRAVTCSDYGSKPLPIRE